MYSHEKSSSRKFLIFYWKTSLVDRTRFLMSNRWKGAHKSTDNSSFQNHVKNCIFTTCKVKNLDMRFFILSIFHMVHLIIRPTKLLKSNKLANTAVHELVSTDRQRFAAILFTPRLCYWISAYFFIIDFWLKIWNMLDKYSAVLWQKGEGDNTTTAVINWKNINIFVERESTAATAKISENIETRR